MPTYEYSCTQCHGHFEYFQGMTEPAKSTCEKCGGALNRLVGAGSGLVFKGSGFYITDYKPTGAGASGSQESSPSTTSTPSSADKSPSGSTSSESSGSGTSSAAPSTGTSTTP